MINEEVSDDVRKAFNIAAGEANGLNKQKGYIRPKNADITNNSMQFLIDNTNKMIDNLILRFTELRKDSDARATIRRLENTPRGILLWLSKHPEDEPLVKEMLGNDNFQVLINLRNVIKSAYNTQKRRNEDGIQNSGYKDFSKEINSLLAKYKDFLDKRLVSVYTEEINYFNY